MQHHFEQQMRGSYKELSVELVIDFVIMYLVMYTMIATLDHFYLYINNVYMTLMMVAPDESWERAHRPIRAELASVSAAVLLCLVTWHS